MGYRTYFYLLDKDDIKTLEEKRCALYDLGKSKELLCIERCVPIYEVWNKARPLFKKGTVIYNYYEEESPCILTKANLREMILGFYELYNNYIINQLLDTTVYEAPKDKDFLYDRCLHLGNDKQTEIDKQHAQVNGMFELQQEFIKNFYLTKYKFEELLEDKKRITKGNSMYDILIQLIYMYKTFSTTKKTCYSRMVINEIFWTSKNK